MGNNKSSETKKSSGPKNITSLEECVNDPDGRQALKDFLKLQFNVESIMFVCEVEDFRAAFLQTKKDSDKKLLEKVVEGAKAVYAKHIKEDASFQVNVPSEVVTRARASRKALIDAKADDMWAVTQALSGAAAGSKTSGSAAMQWLTDRQQECPTLFDEAEMYIMRQLQDSTWPQFIKSDGYAKLTGGAAGAGAGGAGAAAGAGSASS